MPMGTQAHQGPTMLGKRALSTSVILGACVILDAHNPWYVGGPTVLACALLGMHEMFGEWRGSMTPAQLGAFPLVGTLIRRVRLLGRAHD